MGITLRHAPCASCLALVCCFATPAAANDDGWYVGAGLGDVDYTAEGTVTFGGSQFAAKQRPDSDDPLSSSLSAWVGYRFNRSLSIEVGYVSNDDVELTLTNAADEAVATFAFRTEGPTLTIVGTLPLGKWEPYARAGVLYANTKSRIIESDGTEWANSERGLEFIAAIGLGYDVTPNWKARLDVACLFDAGERTGTGASTVYVPTVGLTYSF